MICRSIAVIASLSGIRMPVEFRGARPIIRRELDYSLFFRLSEAQSLGDVLPFIRAHRPKLSHPVYYILNYRMRDIGLRFFG
jgi:hypothetical protein